LAKPLKKTATISIRCTAEMRAKLTTLAKADRRTVSSLAEILLEEALERIEKSRRKRTTPKR
jgi:predicted transcriptional regulator